MKKILFLIISMLISVQFVCAHASNSFGVEVFSQNSKFGLKNKSGEVIAKPIYKKAIRLGEGSWIVQKGNKFGLLDNNGKYMVEPKYRHAERFFGTFVKLGNDTDYGLYNEFGKAIVKNEYSRIDPLFGKMFLTFKNYKCGVIDYDGKVLLQNEFDDIYMPKSTVMRIKYQGEWFDIERLAEGEIILPSNVKKVNINGNDIKITRIFQDTGIISGYSALAAAGYTVKVFSSISPAYEQTIDELMLSQGAETVSIFIKLGWLPKFPHTYVKKYIENVRHPLNDPLLDARYELIKQLSGNSGIENSDI